LYSYYTAGTVGVGLTILETIFLLAGEPVVVCKDGERLLEPLMTPRRNVAYGPCLCWKSSRMERLETQATYALSRMVPCTHCQIRTASCLPTVLCRALFKDSLICSQLLQGAAEGTQPQRLLYSYYTAGTGGVGPTILETTFLLAGEPVVVYKDGERLLVPPMTQRRNVDFGPGLRRKDVWLFNLPEVQSGFETLKVPSVSARFGTSPAIWNFGTWLVARLVPRVCFSSGGDNQALGECHHTDI
jgi:hypothetical protein